MLDDWLEDWIDKALGEKTVEKKYYEFGIPVVYDTEVLKYNSIKKKKEIK